MCDLVFEVFHQNQLPHTTLHLYNVLFRDDRFTIYWTDRVKSSNFDIYMYIDKSHTFANKGLTVLVYSIQHLISLDLQGKTLRRHNWMWNKGKKLKEKQKKDAFLLPGWSGQTCNRYCILAESRIIISARTQADTLRGLTWRDTQAGKKKKANGQKEDLSS